MASPAVVVSLALPWQSWYHHSAILHLCDGDDKPWTTLVHSNKQSYKKTKLLRCLPLTLAVLYRLTLATSIPAPTVCTDIRAAVTNAKAAGL